MELEPDWEVDVKVDMVTGDLRDNLAREVTDSVWVALNRRVWRDLGRCERRAVSVRENPMSNIRSASSRTEKP